MTNRQRAIVVVWGEGAPDYERFDDETKMEIREVELALDEAEKRGMERASEICFATWKNEPNKRESGFSQNQISHGCIRSGEEIIKAMNKTDLNEL